MLRTNSVQPISTLSLTSVMSKLRASSTASYKVQHCASLQKTVHQGYALPIADCQCPAGYSVTTQTLPPVLLSQPGEALAEKVALLLYVHPSGCSGMQHMQVKSRSQQTMQAT